MRRDRLRLTIYTVSALLAAGGGVGVAVAATGPEPAAAAGLTATFSKDSDWGSGYQGRFTIANPGGAARTGWRLEFTLPTDTTLSSFWDANVTRSGNTVVATDRGYNAAVSPGAATAFGFVVTGTGAPTSCTINGAPCAGGGVPAPSAPVPTASGPARTTPPPAPQPTPSKSTPAPTAPPPAASGITVAPYVDMGLLSNPGSPTLAQLAASSGVKAFTMAFVNSAGCKASWFNAFDPRARAFGDQIDALRRAGGDVKISFGGATGIELAQACTDVAALTAEYQAVVDAYQLRFIDLDVEGAAVADPTSVNRRSAALAALQKRNPGLKVSLTLPVLPEGLTADGLNVVKSARDAGVSLDLVNIMAMDYQRAGQDYGDLAIQATKSTAAQLKGLLGISEAQAFRMVGVTPMLGRNDDQGVFNTSDARDVVAFARANQVGYLSFWELNRDRNACNGALFQCTNVPQQPFEFSRIFAGFQG
ncbi:cellulose binding domain-containing protein [Planosporangium sp. 12N6]|uniref:cellulose binding domain-containing protein n=1 Tax=Planosporangium spinosum TaxID=3402278 RepID=UPI003CE873FA